MTDETLRFVRILIAVQLLVSAWFLISPDVLPEPIKQAERLADQAVYAVLDSVIVPLTYLQTLLCLLLWSPTRVRAYAYLGVTALIAVLSAFAGPAILSAVDAFVGYAQVLAAGAMLGILWVFSYLSPSNKLR